MAISSHYYISADALKFWYNIIGVDTRQLNFEDQSTRYLEDLSPFSVYSDYKNTSFLGPINDTTLAIDQECQTFIQHLCEIGNNSEELFQYQSNFFDSYIYLLKAATNLNLTPVKVDESKYEITYKCVDDFPKSPGEKFMEYTVYRKTKEDVKEVFSGISSFDMEKTSEAERRKTIFEMMRNHNIPIEETTDYILNYSRLNTIIASVMKALNGLDTDTVIDFSRDAQFAKLSGSPKTILGKTNRYGLLAILTYLGMCTNKDQPDYKMFEDETSSKISSDNLLQLVADYFDYPPMEEQSALKIPYTRVSFQKSLELMKK